jgi:hypothetical protein
MNKEQFEKNKVWINNQLSDAYPGAKVFWIGLDPSLEIADGYQYDIQKLVSYVQKLYRQCGGECEFYPDKMRKI